LDEDYRDVVLEILWNKADEGLIASEVYKHVKDKFGQRSVSRTAILLFLNDLCKKNALRFREETCRGGRRKRYFPRKSKEEYERDFVRETVLNLIQSWPKYACEAFVEALKVEKPDPDVPRCLLGYFMGRNEVAFNALEQSIWGLGNPINP
jgi:predicted transcriptional regulator